MPPRLPFTPSRVRARCLLLLFTVASVVPFAQAADDSTLPFAQPAWGKIVRDTSDTGAFIATIITKSSDGKLPLPGGFPNITSASLQNGIGIDAVRLPWDISSDSTEQHIELPSDSSLKYPLTALIETGDKSAKLPGGRVLFSALDATVHGSHAKFESQPANHRIGFWTNPSDFVTWDFKPSRWGAYELDVTYSLESGEGSEIEIEVAGQTFPATLRPTGSWYRYSTLAVSRFHLANPQPGSVRVRCKNMKGPDVMNLKAVTLCPVTESIPGLQGAAGTIYLHASNAITHSVNMRYEPSPEKNCLGFWTIPSDWAEWQFTIASPGTFAVDLLAGCGASQGGSEVLLQSADQSLRFQVQDTGDFHRHAIQHLGTITLSGSGAHSLQVRPVNKKGGAIMDIESITLIPSSKER